MLLEKLGKNSKEVVRSVMQDTQGNTGIHSDTQGYTGIHRDTQGYTGIHRDTQGYTEVAGYLA